LKKIIFGLAHPAHFHFYKNVIATLDKGIEWKIVITNKDILRKLLDNEGFKKDVHYHVLADSKFNENLFQKVKKLAKSSVRLYRIAKEFKPDLFIGSFSQLFWVATLLRRPGIFNAEDDFRYTMLQGLITYPFVTTILTPQPVNTGIFSFKQLRYAGFHKLSYLHPEVFKPDVEIKKKYINADRYFLIRIVNQNAYHDINAKGIDPQTLLQTINYLEAHGAIFITSEKPLSEEFKKYELKINPNDIHHILCYADLLIADSQSMTVEAAMLGTPSIRLNSFADKISVIRELEYKYKLTFSLSTTKKDQLISLIQNVLKEDKEVFNKRRQQMLDEKINVSAFLKWFVEEYPASVQVVKKSSVKV
jgi:predicted glycosyltransferase